MTVDLRARRAAAAVHAASAQAEPPVLGTRQSGERGTRTLMAIVVGISMIAGAVLVSARDDSSTTTRTDRGGELTPSTVVSDEDRSGHVGAPVPGVRRGTGGSPDGGSDPVKNPAGAPSPVDGQPGDDSTVPYNCDPLMVDPQGDVDDPTIDILESSMRYDSTTNELVLRHVIDDIPEASEVPREQVYQLHFWLEGTHYWVSAATGAADGGRWTFGVLRAARGATGTNLPYQWVADAVGEVDTAADTATIKVDVVGFNRGERRVAAEEGMPPAAELKQGSSLTSIELYAYPRSVGPGPYDYATGCSFTL